MNERPIPSVVIGRGLVVLACLCLVWLCVRNAAQRLWDTSDPRLTAALWSADGASLSTLALDRIYDAGGTVDATSAALAREALRKSPRDATPLVIAGFAASAAGDLDRAQALMEAARARQPRTQMARYWLLDHYIRTGHYAAALGEIQPAAMLRSEAEPALMDLVGAMAAVPQAHEALVAKLERQPDWRTSFFQREAQNAALPPHIIASLLEALPPNSNPDLARLEQRAVIAALIAKGEYPAAYGVWLFFLPAADHPAAGQIYDPHFSGLAGSEPFNWTLQTGSDASVSRVGLENSTKGALEIQFHAAEPRSIASETLPAPAGSYTLSVEARRGAEPVASGRINAAARCVLDGRILANLPLDPLPTQPQSFAANFNVPPSCPFIAVDLSAQPGDAFGAVAGQISEVSLTRLTHP